MSNPAKRCCLNCIFFHDWKSGDSDGECRIHPPQLARTEAQEQVLAECDDEPHVGFWPGVHYFDWCGDFKRKKSEST